MLLSKSGAFSAKRKKSNEYFCEMHIYRSEFHLYLIVINRWVFIFLEGECVNILFRTTNYLKEFP